MRSSLSLQVIFTLLAVHGWLSCAHAEGSVEGSVALEPMQSSAPPGYRVQTKNPIEPPDPQVAIVYLEKDDGQYPRARTGEVLRIGQRGYQFRPAVTAVQTGSQVAFPNQDDEFHNVFSYSKNKRFDLGRFRRDEKSPVLTFDKAGVVKIYCEIHKHMRNLLLVLDTPWFTTSDAQGRFVLSDIPAGEYSLKAFLPSEKVLQTRVSIHDGKKSSITLAP